MRLGAPLFEKYDGPDEWVQTVRKLGFSAAYCPVDAEQDENQIQSYGKAAEKADIKIAEVGAWCNPLSSDPEERQKAINKCQTQLDLADRIGACCCVNIAGSRGKQWDGPHPDNLTDETFDMIVQTVRTIIDAVKPKRTFYTLEPMPWIFPDSPQSYIRLIRAIDRRHFAVHLDIVNMICSPHRYFANSEFIKECFRILGPYIKSCHAKDILLSGRLTVHLDEMRPGLGGLNYEVLLQELDKLDPDIPLLLEHLPNEQEYILAADFIRKTAKRCGINIY